MDPRVGGPATSYPLQPGSLPAFERLAARAGAGLTKFDKRLRVRTRRRTLFSSLSDPHDESIVLHSGITSGPSPSVKERRDIPVVVKGHPMNREAMALLREIADAHPLGRDGRYSRCPAGAAGGVGDQGSAEALLHGKPVATFGRVDYDAVAVTTLSEDPCRAYDTIPDTSVQQDFVETWYESNALKTPRCEIR